MTENTRQTLVAFVRLAATLIAACLTAFGMSIDADTVYIIFGGVVTLAAFIWSWWKNNNITSAATEAQEFVELFRAQEDYTDDEEPEEEVVG